MIVVNAQHHGPAGRRNDSPMPAPLLKIWLMMFEPQSAFR